jgi:MFS family permease
MLPAPLSPPVSTQELIINSYFLTLSAFQPLYGKLSDIFGRKQCLLFSYTIFGLGSTLCGFSQNMSQLIAARAFSGIGGAGMFTVLAIIFSDIVPLQERGVWQGYANVVFAAGSGTGAPLGGLLADTIGWRWAFIAQGPLCAIAITAVAIVLQMPQQDHSHWKDKIMKVDFLGAITLITAVFGLLLGLDRGSNFSWRAPVTIAALSTTPLFMVFILVEKYAANPFAPLRIILNRNLLPCYLCNFFAFAAYMATLFYTPLYWQVRYDLSASKAGLLLVPCITTGVMGSLASGFYMKRTGRYYFLTGSAYTLLLCGLTAVLLFSGTVAELVPGMVLGTCMASIGNGIGVTTTLIALIATVAHSDQAIVTASSYLFRSLGSVFGIAMGATAFNSALRSRLEHALGRGEDAEEVARKVRESISYLKELEPSVREVVRDAYGSSARAAFGVCLVLSVGCAASGWFVREKRLKG